MITGPATKITNLGALKNEWLEAVTDVAYRKLK
jgi:hypothetical protein